MSRVGFGEDEVGEIEEAVEIEGVEESIEFDEALLGNGSVSGQSSAWSMSNRAALCCTGSNLSKSHWKVVAYLV